MESSCFCRRQGLELLALHHLHLSHFRNSVPDLWPQKLSALSIGYWLGSMRVLEYIYIDFWYHLKEITHIHNGKIRWFFGEILIWILVLSVLILEVVLHRFWKRLHAREEKILITASTIDFLVK